MAANSPTTCRYNLEENINKTMENRENKITLKKFIKPIIAELIGTIFFILLGLLGACNEENSNKSLIAGLAFGFSLMIFAGSLGQISGGHFNPAVTLGIFIAGGIEIKKALVYVLMQLIGGILGAGIFRLLSHTNMYQTCHGGATFLVTIKSSNELGQLTNDRINWWEGLAVELLLTFVFVTIILMVTMNKQFNNHLAPIYIGWTLAVCIFGSNMLTGGSLNPARSLGPAIFANIWAFHYIYWLGPLIGASIAGSLYRFVWNSNEQEN